MAAFLMISVVVVVLNNAQILPQQMRTGLTLG